MDTKTDNRGVEYVEDAEYETLPSGWALCGHCHRGWNDDKSTSVTPTPSGRCPFEYEHVYEDEPVATATTIYLVVKPENILNPSVYAFANETDRDAFFATIGPSDSAYTDDVEILTSADAQDLITEASE